MERDGSSNIEEKWKKEREGRKKKEHWRGLYSIVSLH